MILSFLFPTICQKGWDMIEFVLICASAFYAFPQKRTLYLGINKPPCMDHCLYFNTNEELKYCIIRQSDVNEEIPLARRVFLSISKQSHSMPSEHMMTFLCLCRVHRNVVSEKIVWPSQWVPARMEPMKNPYVALPQNQYLIFYVPCSTIFFLFTRF